MSQAPDIPGAEFSRLIEVEALGTDAIEQTLEASGTERAALARRFGLFALDRLEARVTVQREPGRRVRLTGRFQADLQQRCVVTLVPVTSRIDDRFVTVYADDPAIDDGPIDNGPIDDGPIDWDDDEEIERLENGTIDLGEAVVQQLAVRIDPYPRAPGAALPEAYRAEDGTEQAKASPFEELAELRKRN